jgi:lysozyme
MNINPKVIDLYHGDAVSSFEDAYKAGIRGVIHKATEGATLSDRAYARRRVMALDAGMLWGAYHFLRPGDPAGQARRFLDEARPTEATLIAVDHEDTRVPLAALVRFLDELEAAGIRKRVVYSGFLIKEQLPRADDYQRAVLAQCELWLAHYAAAPRWPALWKTPFLWQFTGGGEGPEPHSTPGIHGAADLSAFDGGDDELAAQWNAA